MNGLSCVKGEIHNVLAVLRITGRSSSSFFEFSSVSRDNIEILRHKLLTSFKELHLFLGFNNDLHSIDTTLFLRPFLDVLLSDIRGVDVMNVTLTSIHKFLLYGLIDDLSPKCESSLHLILDSLIQCKFDNHSRSDAELIHIRIMEILLELLRCPAGYLLSNDDVCLCVQKCFEIYNNYSNNHIASLMVRYTENVLIQMILLIFGKLKKSASKSFAGGYNIKSHVRIFKYLTHIIDTSNVTSIRIFGLRLINVLLETCGTNLNNYPLLISIIQDDLCRQLLTNSQSSSFSILSLTLRVIFNLFNVVKDCIRVQLEVFFISIHLRIAESKKSSFEQKELILESIVEFCREPDLIIGLYTNYDCQIGSTHLFEDLCKFLLIKAKPKYNNIKYLNELHLIAAEGILAIIDCISRKFIDNNTTSPANITENKDNNDNSIEIQQIKQSQKKKRKLKLSGRHFNNKLSKSFPYLQEIGILDKPLDPLNVAQFLYTNTYIDRTQIGQYLGKKKDFNTRVLDEYVNLFNFTNFTPDEALRYFLESFVLKGEAQQIERIIENFSKKLFNDTQDNNSSIKSTDSAFLLSYSMIQLNTDAHNDQIKNKMTFESYKKNLKGVNDGTNFPDKFLFKIYNSITNNEIKVRTGNFRDIFSPNISSYSMHHMNASNSNIIIDDIDVDNNDNDNDNDDNNSVSSTNTMSSNSSYYNPNVKGVKPSEWNKIMKDSQIFTKFLTIAPSTNGAEMFNILWEPALEILQFHLKYAGHPKVLDRVVQGIQTLAKIAHSYQIRSAFNAIMHSLCNHLIMCFLQFGTENQLLPTTFDSKIYINNNNNNDNDNDNDDNDNEKKNDIKSISVPYFLSATSSSSFNNNNNDNNKSINDYNDISSDGNILAMDIRITFTVKIYFDLVKNYGGLLLTDGWSSVIKVLLWLFHLDLIPNNIFEMEDFTDSDGIPLPSLSDIYQIDNNNDNNNGTAVDVITSWISNTFTSIFSNDNQQSNNISPRYLQQQSDNNNQQTKDNQQSNDKQQLNDNDNNNDINDDKNASQFLDPKCQNIVDSISECEIFSLFAKSDLFSLNSVLHLVRTLISLSNTSVTTTLAASSLSSLKDNNPSITTHTITSLDPLPVQTSDLIDNDNNNMNINKSNQDVICLPLTIDMKIFCLERLSQILSVNINRINDLWLPIHDHFTSLIKTQIKQNNNNNNNIDDDDMDNNDADVIDTIRHSNYFFERIIVNVLKLCIELMENDNNNTDNTQIDDNNYNEKHINGIMTFFNLFLSLNDPIFHIVGRRIIAGIKLLLNYSCFIRREKDWKIILYLMKKFSSYNDNNESSQCCLEAFHVIESISKRYISQSNFNHIISSLTVFGKHEQSAPIHCTRVIELILSIHSKLPQITSNQILLGQMWHKTLSNIARFGAHTDYTTRRFAINCLHKALLQYPIKLQATSHAEPSKLLFQTVLLPLLLQLTKYENQRLSQNNSNTQSVIIDKFDNDYDLKSDDNTDNALTTITVTNEDLRLKLLSLIFQVWLHDVNILIQLNDFHILWYKFLSTIKKFLLMVADKNNGLNLVTHCIESLKNVILVFQSTKIFQSLSNKTNTDVWSETWNILSEVTPNLKQEFIH